MKAMVLAGMVLAGPAPALSECIPLSPGHSVKGEARWSGDNKPVDCVTLSAPVGTQVAVQVEASDNDVAFTIPGEVEVQDKHAFMTKRPSYHIDVFHMFNHPPVAFTLEAR